MRSAELRACCLGFDGASEEFPFTAEHSVFKVGGKMFAISALERRPLQVSLKCEPELAVELRRTYPAIRPGYHLNKRHWNTIDLDGSLPDTVLRDLIEDSYDLVVAGLPKRVRGMISRMNQAERLAENQRNIEEFRVSGGRISSFGDSPVLLLTSTGAKSGQPRTAPMMYLADESDPDRLYVFASNGGRDQDPAWVQNVVAEPAVTVEVGDERLAADAEVLAEPRRSEIYAIQAERYPAFARFEAGTARAIPVVALTLNRA